MSLAVKFYITAVIAVGGMTVGAALFLWNCSDPTQFAVLLALALVTSLVKLRLPGIDGSYSLNFLFILVGVARFSLAETLVVACSAALVESVFFMQKRPTLLQIAFNLANVAVSVGACFAVAYGPLALTMHSSPSVALMFTAAVFFFVNTVLVSGVLALLSAQSLKGTCLEWYLWAFPYYLAGAALVGALPSNGTDPAMGFGLILVPALYLIHFFWAVSKGLGHRVDDIEASPSHSMPTAAKGFVATVVAAGVGLVAWSVIDWNVPGAERLNMHWMYLPAVLFASVVKVWLPGLTGTISLSFVVLLAACSQLSFPEVVLLSVLAAIVQSFWRPQVRPGTVQVVFNAGVVVLGSASAYAIVGGWATRETAMALYARLGLAALAMYAVTTILVATVCCLVAQRPLRVLWQSFCFWTMPYYLVGAAFAGLIASAPNGRGSTVLLALPLLALIGVSYRIHLRRAEHISE